jgi:hypothetical protein
MIYPDIEYSKVLIKYRNVYRAQWNAQFKQILIKKKLLNKIKFNYTTHYSIKTFQIIK